MTLVVIDAPLCVQLLWNSHIAAVNAALRHVAARESLPLLDLERIMMQLPAAHVHARDGFHPQVTSTHSYTFDGIALMLAP